MWLWDPLNITFIISGDCRGYGYSLYRDGNPLDVPHDYGTVNGDRFFTFMVNNITKDFDNASMQVIGIKGLSNIIEKRFTIHTQGQYWCNLHRTITVVTLTQIEVYMCTCVAQVHM